MKINIINTILRFKSRNKKNIKAKIQRFNYEFIKSLTEEWKCTHQQLNFLLVSENLMVKETQTFTDTIWINYEHVQHHSMNKGTVYDIRGLIY